MYCERDATCIVENVCERIGGLQKCQMNELERESLRIKQSYGLWGEAVPERGGAGSDAALLSARRQQAEQFVTGVNEVSEDPVGPPLQLTPINLSACFKLQIMHITFPNNIHQCMQIVIYKYWGKKI